jgi:hypothetical protein
MCWLPELGAGCDAVMGAWRIGPCFCNCVMLLPGFEEQLEKLLNRTFTALQVGARSVRCATAVNSMAIALFRALVECAGQYVCTVGCALVCDVT